MKECSFKPVTNDYPLQQETCGDKNIDLYKKIQKKQYANRKTVASDEFELRKNPEEYRFTPNINHNVKISRDSQASNVKGFDKTMQRLEAARQQKLEKSMITERGIPSQMIAKLKNGIPDNGMVMTHKPSKFKTSFGVEGSEIVTKSNYDHVLKEKKDLEKRRAQEAKDEATRNQRIISQKSLRK